MNPVEIAHSYPAPISTFMFNYKNTLTKFNDTECIRLMKYQCSCNTNPAKDIDHGHIITGDILSICDNAKIINTLKKGTKFRLNELSKTKDLVDSILHPIRVYLDKLEVKLKIDPLNTARYTSIIEGTIQQKIATSKYNTTCNNIRDFDKKAMASLKKDFIITPLDKASSNYGFTCKKFYLSEIMKELGISIQPDNTLKLQGNDTYKWVNRPKESIIQNHVIVGKSYGLTVTTENQELPVLYAIPKMHKKPVKFRFISGARNSSTKQISVMLLNILKFLKNHLINYCKTAESRSFRLLYISVDNSLQVLDHINKYKINIATANSYDFSTLYTTLPHKTIMANCNYLVDLLFNHRGTDYIYTPITNYGYTHYPTEITERSETSRFIKLHRNEVKNLIHTVITESFVTIGPYIFKQVKGIPMGNNAAPLIADLTLSIMEFQYLKSCEPPIKKSICIKRYLDDILEINSNFGTIRHKIYPQELTLNHEKTVNKVISYLDLNIDLADNTITIYNKTDHFNFPVIRIIDKDSCIHKNVIRGTIIGRIKHFIRVLKKPDQLVLELIKLTTPYVSNGQNREFVVQAMVDALIKNSTLLWKYNCWDQRQATNLFLIPVISSW